MSEDFIPLNQSTPVHRHKQWQGQQIFYQGGQQGQNMRTQNQNMRGSYRNNYGNNSHNNSSFGYDSNNSQGKDTIEAYLHPSMLQDPWANLRRRNAEKQSTQT